MKKFLVCVVVLLFAVGAADAATWLKDEWKSKGNGWTQKGTASAQTKDSGSVKFGFAQAAGKTIIVSVDITAKIDLSAYGLGEYSYTPKIVAKTPVPVPDVAPTVSSPVVLDLKILQPTGWEDSEIKMTDMVLKIDSITNGSAVLKGEIKKHGVKFDLGNVVWEKIAPEPAEPPVRPNPFPFTPPPPSGGGGCNAGFFGVLLFSLPMLLMKKK